MTVLAPFSSATLVGVLAALVALAPGFALAQDADVSNRLLRLERELSTLNQAVFQGASPPAPAPGDDRLSPEYAASVEVRLADIETQLRRLTGQVETQGFRIQQFGDRLDRALSDLEFRLSILEDGGGAGLAQTPGDTVVGASRAPSQPGSAAPGAATSAGSLGTLTIGPGGDVAGASVASAPPQAVPEAALSGDPASRYQAAFDLLVRQQYEAAEVALANFVADHPTHEDAGKAQFWLGETYYHRGRLPDAAAAFAQAYQQYPSGSKAADSLFKLGVTLGNMGRVGEACLTFETLVAEFRDLPRAIDRRVAGERDRLQCG